MTLRKTAKGEVLPEEGDLKKEASVPWSPEAQEELRQELAASDDDA